MARDEHGPLPHQDEGRIWFWDQWAYRTKLSTMDHLGKHAWLFPVPEDYMARMPEKLKAHYAKLNAEAGAKKARLRQCDTEAVAYARGLAGPALDSWHTAVDSMTQPDAYERALWHTSEVEWLLRFALLDHKLQYPKSRGERHWILHTDGDTYSSPRLVVCRYCRLVLRPGLMRADYSESKEVQPHVTQCALESLAGLRTPSPPGAPLIRQ